MAKSVQDILRLIRLVGKVDLVDVALVCRLALVRIVENIDLCAPVFAKVNPEWRGLIILLEVVLCVFQIFRTERNNAGIDHILQGGFAENEFNAVDPEMHFVNQSPCKRMLY